MRSLLASGTDVWPGFVSSEMAVGYCFQTPAHLLVAQSGVLLCVWNAEVVPLEAARTSFGSYLCMTQNYALNGLMQSVALGCDSLGLSQSFFSASILLFFLLLWSLLFSAPFISVPFLSPILLLLILSFQVGLLFLVFISCLFCIDPVSSHANCVNHNVPYLGKTRGGQHAAIMASCSRNTQVTVFLGSLNTVSGQQSVQVGDETYTLSTRQAWASERCLGDLPLCTSSFVTCMSWATLSPLLQCCFPTVFWISCPSVSKTLYHMSSCDPVTELPSPCECSYT